MFILIPVSNIILSFCDMFQYKFTIFRQNSILDFKGQVRF